jgi:hypothetical protein
MSDLISRQAAIDTLMEILDKPNHADFLYTDEIYNALNGLPSVQPEIVRCKDCRYRKFVDFGMGDCLHPSGCRGIAFDNHFCALGERREDQDDTDRH